jgi:HEAT repeat protein
VLRRAVLLLLLPCAAGLGDEVEEAKAPLLIFREPDSDTARDIKKWISQEGIGASDRNERREARAHLLEVGAWSVPSLQKEVERSVGERVPMNSIMVLARIFDPAALPQIRVAARKSRHPFVRQTACLTLGIFGESKDCSLLAERMKDRDHKRRHQRAAALGLAKIGTEKAATYLRPMTDKQRLPADDHTAAAVVLASAIADPEFDILGRLSNPRPLVRRAATVALLARPIVAAEAKPLLTRLRNAQDKRIRALQFRALSAVRERTPEIRGLLLDCATKEKRYKKPERIAAAIGLAAEWGVEEHYKPLRNAYRSASSRNDALNGALLFALAHTRKHEAIEVLLDVVEDGSEWLACYAVGSLLVCIAEDRLPPAPKPEEDPRRSETEVESWEANDVLARIDGRGGRTKDAILGRLIDLSRKLRTIKDRDERRRVAREELGKIPDPSGLHLWDRTTVDRRWDLINHDFLPVIFELDALVDYGDPLSRAEEAPVETHRSRVVPPGDDAEQDLFDFLTEKPYFGTDDVAGREGDGR